MVRSTAHYTYVMTRFSKNPPLNFELLVGDIMDKSCFAENDSILVLKGKSFENW